jgi:tryptophan-rich sensory protein
MGMDFVSSLKVQSVPKLVAAVLFCLVLGSLGSIVTVTGSGSWFAQLVKPSFQPPNWLFGPMWTTLFILMGIALYLVWELGTEKPEVRFALGIFGAQFALNIIWSFLFFGLQSPLLGLLDIIILWWMILATIILFYRIRKGAAFFLIPYIAWVTIATAVNAAIYLLNP